MEISDDDEETKDRSAEEDDLFADFMNFDLSDDEDDDFEPTIEEIADIPEPDMLELDVDDLSIDFDDISNIDSSIDDFGSDQ